MTNSIPLTQDTGLCFNGFAAIVTFSPDTEIRALFQLTNRQYDVIGHCGHYHSIRAISLLCCDSLIRILLFLRSEVLFVLEFFILPTTYKVIQVFLRIESK